MFKSNILRLIKWIDNLVFIAFLLLVGIYIAFGSDSTVVWDFTTRAPYEYIFNLILAVVLGLFWRVIIDYIKFKMNLYLNQLNSKSN